MRRYRFLRRAPIRCACAQRPRGANATFLILIAGVAVATAAAASPKPAQAGDSARYVCSDGRVIEVLYGGGVAVLTINGDPVEMQPAPAEQGERYEGGGWQWVPSGKRSGSLRALHGGGQPNPVTSCSAP